MFLVQLGDSEPCALKMMEKNPLTEREWPTIIELCKFVIVRIVVMFTLFHVNSRVTDKRHIVNYRGYQEVDGHILILMDYANQGV